MFLVKVVPRSKRAKERVKQHGEVFELVDNNQNNGMLVKSLDRTFSNNGDKIEWMGWFKDHEAEINHVNGEANNV